ncbi:MAG TPA: serine hydrolase domain-containing protein [Pyrinomonadaceae bacterium]|nr:serine hydrolase domain-containing protein [Pyrinomonadaceae bacterium]
MTILQQQHLPLTDVLAARIEAGDFPSAVYHVAERGRVRFCDALGHAVREPREVRATAETIYDLASLTKPLVTGLLCARRVERGEIELDAPVADYLGEFGRGAHRAATVRQLLTHTSGLPAWRPLRALTGDRRERTLETIAALPREYEPCSKVIYSDLGFITLGLLIERCAGTTLAELARREIFAPLELSRTFFNSAAALQTEVAACELSGNSYEREMCRAGDDAAAADSVAWREQPIWGEVHDGNAYFLAGEAGHAGLFSTGHETVRLAEQFLAARTALLRPATCELFRTNMTARVNEARSFAWQLAATPESTAGTALPPDGFGHLGFTGTSCWIDPVRERVFVLLTNRTHTRKLPFVNINSVRRQFHTLAAAALDGAQSREGVDAETVQGGDAGARGRGGAGI